MKERDIETYMDAFMEGFWQCYNVMFDLIEDDETVETETEPLQKQPETAEKPPVVAKPTKPKDEPKNEPKQGKKEPPTHEEYVELFKQGKLPTEVAKALGVAPQTAYNHLYKARQDGELK